MIPRYRMWRLRHGPAKGSWVIGYNSGTKQPIIYGTSPNDCLRRLARRCAQEATGDKRFNANKGAKT